MRVNKHHMQQAPATITIDYLLLKDVSHLNIKAVDVKV